MKVRRLLVLTALVSSILGAVAAYLAMTVPNDLKAGSLLKEARTHQAGGRNAEARDTLAQLIQHFPRTDAAAAALVALVKLDEQERERLQKEVARLRTEWERQARTMVELQKNLESVRATAAKAAAPPAPAQVGPAKKTPAKKTPAKRKTTTKTRRKR